MNRMAPADDLESRETKIKAKKKPSRVSFLHRLPLMIANRIDRTIDAIPPNFRLAFKNTIDGCIIVFGVAVPFFHTIANADSTFLDV